MDFGALAPQLLANHGLHIGDWFAIPWSWVILIAIVAIGLLLIRTAITLVKVAIIVAIGFAIWYVVQFLLNNFAG